jgi:hypothetical protein
MVCGCWPRPSAAGGDVQRVRRTWLRWSDRDGKVIPTGEERAAEECKRADAAAQSAVAERKRAEETGRKLEELTAKLRQLGIEPDMRFVLRCRRIAETTSAAARACPSSVYTAACCIWLDCCPLPRCTGGMAPAPTPHQDAFQPVEIMRMTLSLYAPVGFLL